jgi:hypothetical protein
MGETYKKGKNIMENKEPKICIACSMPMEKPEDFACGDVSKDYCCYCANADGTMKSYEDTLEYSIAFAMEGDNYKMMGFSKRPTADEARKHIVEYMKTLPAWKDM